jgi:hypothetical protein
MKSKTETASIEDVSTKELLNALHPFYHPLYYGDDSERQQILVAHRTVAGGKSVPIYATESQVRQELAKRPHLPSKREGAALRRARAKAGV